MDTTSSTYAPTLREYSQILWRRKWIVFLVAAFAVAVSIGVSLKTARVYQSSAEVLLRNDNLAASLTGVGTPPVTNEAWLDQTQADLAGVPAVASRAIAIAGVRTMSASQLLADSTVKPHGNSDLLDFVVRGRQAAIVRRLASAYAVAYTRYRQEIDTAAISRALTQAESRLSALRASADIKSQLYSDVATKVQTLQTMEALETSNAFVVRSGSRASQVSPRPRRDAAIALALGLIVGLGIAFLRETLDTRVRSGDEIAAALRLPLLARAPAPSKRSAGKRRLEVLTDPGGATAESFRLLRTNLDFATLERETRSILVTSALQAEGKSTTAASLAVTLARAGRRVVLADLDLRQPSVHAFFDLERVPGVSTVCLGECSLDEALRPVPIGGGGVFVGPPTALNGNGRATENMLGSLFVLPSGQLPPDPGEFVGTKIVAELLAELVARSDWLIIDAPPLLHAVDALTVSSRVDGVLVVVRPKLLRRPVLRELRRVLDSTPAPKLGFVLGDAEPDAAYGFGYYSYDPRPEIAATPQRR